ncbi:MAG: tRNA dihydrouridine synthase DusB [Anaerolineales bacterium]|nr:tRNA dihydrouridine synthase DusB [Anaerolineales bacterium]MCW5887279.1 tRNA dihydrouridine synthase DusB [Anaerolineales bacterium]
MSEPAFHIGLIPIYGRVILSPMDGFSDQPFRSLARQLGSAISYTEFVNAQDVLNGHPHLHQRLAFLEAERPVAFQLFDDEPERLLQAAIQLQAYSPDTIDINMGCSVRCVSGRGAGAGLLRQPAKIAHIFRSLSRALQIPITGKIRIGWDEDSLNHTEIAKIIEDNGGAAIAVHGRTKAQAYRGNANWDAIAEVKAAVSIPVFGNGDVRQVADIGRMREHTGCDAVMIGRGAIGNPWIFAGLDRAEVSAAQVRHMVLAHMQAMQSFYGAELGLVLFRKHAARYISPYGLSEAQRARLLNSHHAVDFMTLLDELALQPAMAAAT